MTVQVVMPQLEILGSVIIAMILGGIIGFEREHADKPAGLRTHMLVAGAATLLVSLGSALVATVEINPSLIRSDPIRIVEAIITGISFLGAGTIMRRRGEGNVEGLTTAASLLFVAGIGIAVGTGQYVTAVGMTLLGLLVLYPVNALTKN
ncbi:MAG TPA: MgtC/SapB family protein [Caldilineaceae bacterium]|nr:MgtC/SapB family protein [Caldilineaceae bacterium]